MNNISLCLRGSEAFFNQPGYIEDTARELQAPTPPMPPLYHHRQEASSFFQEVAKSILWLPKLPYQALQKACMVGVVPSQYPLLTNIYPDIIRKHLIPKENEEKVCKRFAVGADELIVDALIMGSKENLDNRKWMVFSVGNGECYELYATDPEVLRLAYMLDVNILFYNHPGVGGSSNPANATTFIKAHEAMLHFMVDSLHATTIVDWGHSIGCAVHDNQYIPPVSYLRVKSRGFVDIARAAGAALTGISVIGLPLSLVDAKFDCIEASVHAPCPEIILQSGVGNQVVELREDSDLDLLRDYDPIVKKEVTLAYGLFQRRDEWRGEKRFFAIPQGHGDGMPNLNFIRDVILETLP
ncbi:MAG: hypothetical protein Q8K75_02090 [Chlamydiales bacterium]|nr:hypothetical protein [Chlamydiales bacterium]